MSCILPKRLDTEIWIGNIGYKMNKAEKTYLWFTSFVFLQYHRMNEHYYCQNNKDGAVLLHFQPLTFPSSFIALLSAVTSA